MRRTLLEMTQDILSALDSDEVNSIQDTVEAGQVASLIKSTYYDIITDTLMPEHSSAFQLNPSNTSTKPVLMTVPDNVVKVDNIRYDTRSATETRPKYELVEYRRFADFIIAQNALQNDTTNVGAMSVTMNNETFTFLYTTNKAPQFYTTADDQTYIFDSYDNTVDSTLQKTKTLCQGQVFPAFLVQDSFIPDLDPTQFPLLFNKAKVRAFNELKQTENREAITETRRQKIVVQKRKRKTESEAEIMTGPRYGR